MRVVSSFLPVSEGERWKVIPGCSGKWLAVVVDDTLSGSFMGKKWLLVGDVDKTRLEDGRVNDPVPMYVDLYGSLWGAFAVTVMPCCPSERIEFTTGMSLGVEDWWSVHSKSSRCRTYHAKPLALTPCLSESEGGSPEEEKSVRVFVSRLWYWWQYCVLL